MGLYDRDYARGGAQAYKTAHRSDSQIVSFVKETYKLFAASMLAGAVGAYVGIPLAASIQGAFLPLVILEFALLFGLFFVKDKPGINLIVMFAFTFMTGITTAPLLAYTLNMPGGAAVVGNAFAMTSVIFGGMSFFAIKTTKDFTGFGKPLLIALIVIVIGSLLNAFLLHSPMLMIGISAAVVVLFTIMIVFDTQNIIRGAYSTPVEGAIALYLDFLNLFVALLQLFGIFGGSEE
jgi:modulator of FtsH protease